MEINENKNDSDNLQLKLLTVTVTVTLPTQVQTSLRREELSSRVISLFLDPSDTHLLSFPHASFSFAIFIPPTFHHFTI